MVMIYLDARNGLLGTIGTMVVTVIKTDKDAVIPAIGTKTGSAIAEETITVAVTVAVTVAIGAQTEDAINIKIELELGIEIEAAAGTMEDLETGTGTVIVEDTREASAAIATVIVAAREYEETALAAALAAAAAAAALTIDAVSVVPLIGHRTTEPRTMVTTTRTARRILILRMPITEQIILYARSPAMLAADTELLRPVPRNPTTIRRISARNRNFSRRKWNSRKRKRRRGSNRRRT